MRGFADEACVTKEYEIDAAHRLAGEITARNERLIYSQDDERDVYTGELYACAAYSGDLPWSTLSSAEKRREFWEWWLTEAAPQAYLSVTG